MEKLEEMKAKLTGNSDVVLIVAHTKWETKTAKVKFYLAEEQQLDFLLDNPGDQDLLEAYFDEAELLELSVDSVKSHTDKRWVTLSLYLSMDGYTLYES